MPKEENKEKILTKELYRTAVGIEDELEKSNSLPRKFFSGIISGFGTVIGATILVTLFAYILGILSHHGILTGVNDWIIDRLQPLSGNR